MACGKIDRKWEALLRDRVSAWMFELPAKCDTEIKSLNFAAIKYKQRMRPIAMGSLLVPVLHSGRVLTYVPSFFPKQRPQVRWAGTLLLLCCSL